MSSTKTVPPEFVLVENNGAILNQTQAAAERTGVVRAVRGGSCARSQNAARAAQHLSWLQQALRCQSAHALCRRRGAGGRGRADSLRAGAEGLDTRQCRQGRKRRVVSPRARANFHERGAGARVLVRPRSVLAEIRAQTAGSGRMEAADQRSLCQRRWGRAGEDGRAGNSRLERGRAETGLSAEREAGDPARSGGRRAPGLRCAA